MSVKKASANEPVKTRKKAERKYRVSWDMLQAMDISAQAKQEMVDRGVAQPDPFTRRLEGFDGPTQNAMRSLQNAVDAFNKNHDRVSVRLQIVKHVEVAADPATTEAQHQ